MAEIRRQKARERQKRREERQKTKLQEARDMYQKEDGGDK